MFCALYKLSFIVNEKMNEPLEMLHIDQTHSVHN